MEKKNLKKLLTVLRTGAEPLESTDELDRGVKQLTDKLRKQMSAKTLDEVNGVLADFQKKIDLGPIKKGLEDLKGDNGRIYKDLQEKISTFFSSFSGRLEKGLKRLDSEQISARSTQENLTLLQSDFKGKSTLLEGVKTVSDQTKKDFEGLSAELKTFVKELKDSVKNASEKDGELEGAIESLSDAFEKLRVEMLSKLASVGGGNMNRNISVNGNSSVLSRYTDINIKPGSGVTLTYQNNDTTKNLDLTISANGSGSGITREINTTTVSSVIGSVAGIDYVTLVNAGAKITMPPAAGNTNLYTIKNIGTSSVLIVADGAETFDGDANIIMPVRYTSVDLSSDETNWHIT